LSAEEAHALSPPGSPDRLLDFKAGAGRKLLIQAGCAGCHVERHGGVLTYDADVVPDVAAGRDLFIAQGCIACHRVAGLYASAERGPELTAVGARRPWGSLKAYLRDPQAGRPVSPMPPVSLVPGDFDRLVTFLTSLAGPAGEKGTSRKGALLSGVAQVRLVDLFPAGYPSTQSLATGAFWARKLGCAGCHRLGEKDTGVPDLRYTGWVRSRSYVDRILKQPRSEVTGTNMARVDMPDAVVESLVEYLAGEKAPLPSSPGDVYEGVCGRCHGGKRDPKVVVLSKKPPDLGGGRPAIGKDKFVATVTEGREGTAMPPWGRVMSKAFIDLIYVYMAGDHGD